MNKIDLKFKELREKNEKALIPFIALGDKSLDETVEIAQVLEKAGADIVELGIPFSDPLADGPIIQDAYHRALTSGINIKDMIKTVENITSKINIPVIIMVYYNVVYCKGVEKFLSDLENAGVSGIIVPDVPLEEREELLKAKNANKFIDAGNKVKVTMRFRGRELNFVEQGKEIMSNFRELVIDAQVDKEAKMEGKNLTMFLSPAKNK